MSKTSSGNFFEDFRLGQVIQHATPRTITVGDVALYTALYGPRFAVQSSDEFARALGRNQHRQDVLEYVRWVMVRKRDEAATASADAVPTLPEAVEAGALGGACPILNIGAYDPALAGSAARLADYKPGERIDHVD